MPAGVRERDLEQAAFGWLGELGYAVACGPDLAAAECVRGEVTE